MPTEAQSSAPQEREIRTIHQDGQDEILSPQLLTLSRSHIKNGAIAVAEHLTEHLVKAR